MRRMRRVVPLYLCRRLDIAPALYKSKFTSKCSGIKWFCGECEDNVGKWLGGLANMIERQDMIELDIQEIKKVY